MGKGKGASTAFGPNGARFVVPLSLQMEAGAQPERGAAGPWRPPDVNYPDLPTEKWYEYGVKEGVPRLLDMYDRRKVKVISHMVGLALEKHSRASRMRTIEEVIVYAQRHPGVAFMRKDEIARFALWSPMTMREGEFA